MLMHKILFVADVSLAVIAALYINKRMIGFLGSKASVWTGPITEESLKTLPAFWLSMSILYVHVCFGIIEAVYELWHTVSRQTLAAGAVAVATHTAFGAISVWVYGHTHSILLALLSATLLHMVWNGLILYFSGHNGGCYE